MCVGSESGRRKTNPDSGGTDLARVPWDASGRHLLIGCVWLLRFLWSWEKGGIKLIFRRGIGSSQRHARYVAARQTVSGSGSDGSRRRELSTCSRPSIGKYPSRVMYGLGVVESDVSWYLDNGSNTVVGLTCNVAKRFLSFTYLF